MRRAMRTPPGSAGSRREFAGKAVRAPLVTAPSFVSFMRFVVCNPKKIADFSCNIGWFLPK